MKQMRLNGGERSWERREEQPKKKFKFMRLGPGVENAWKYFRGGGRGDRLLLKVGR